MPVWELLFTVHVDLPRSCGTGGLRRYAEAFSHGLVQLPLIEEASPASHSEADEVLIRARTARLDYESASRYAHGIALSAGIRSAAQTVRAAEQTGWVASVEVVEVASGGTAS